MIVSSAGCSRDECSYVRGEAPRSTEEEHPTNETDVGVSLFSTEYEENNGKLQHHVGVRTFVWTGTE